MCLVCGGVFRPPADFPSIREEKTRYEEHENDVEDTRYQRFVSPITDIVQKEQSTNTIGLDFGSGTAPVISKVLDDEGYLIKQYDPIFCTDPNVLKSTYD